MVVGLTAALTCVATADAHFVIVAYENRPGITSMLQQSAEESSVTYRAGALAPGSVRRYHSADRPAWLERELENDSSSSNIFRRGPDDGRRARQTYSVQRQRADA